jgi:hypothetical protein
MTYMSPRRCLAINNCSVFGVVVSHLHPVFFIIQSTHFFFILAISEIFAIGQCSVVMVVIGCCFRRLKCQGLDPGFVQTSTTKGIASCKRLTWWVAFTLGDA